MRRSKVFSGVKTREQLAREYNISRRTLYNWLKHAKITTKGKLLSPLELKQIYELFGHPEDASLESNSPFKTD